MLMEWGADNCGPAGRVRLNFGVHALPSRKPTKKKPPPNPKGYGLFSATNPGCNHPDYIRQGLVVVCVLCAETLCKLPEGPLDEPWKRYVDRLLSVLRKATPKELELVKLGGVKPKPKKTLAQRKFSGRKSHRGPVDL